MATVAGIVTEVNEQFNQVRISPARCVYDYAEQTVVEEIEHLKEVR